MKVEIRRVESHQGAQGLRQVPLFDLQGRSLLGPAPRHGRSDHAQEGQESRLRVLRGRVLDGFRRTAGRSAASPASSTTESSRNGAGSTPASAGSISSRISTSPPPSSRPSRTGPSPRASRASAAPWASPTSTRKGCSSRASTSWVPMRPATIGPTTRNTWSAWATRRTSIG